MCGGYDSCFVCVSDTALVATYLVCKSQVKCHKVPYGVSNMCCVDCAENVLFSSFDIQLQPSMLSGKFLIDMMNSNGFFPRRKLHTFCDTPWKSTDPSL